MTLLHLVQDVETGLELLEEEAPGGHFKDDQCNCWHVRRVYLSLFWCLLKEAPQGCQAPPSPLADVGILHSMVEVGDGEMWPDGLPAGGLANVSVVPTRPHSS